MHESTHLRIALSIRWCTDLICALYSRDHSDIRAVCWYHIRIRIRCIVLRSDCLVICRVSQWVLSYMFAKDSSMVYSSWRLVHSVRFESTHQSSLICLVHLTKQTTHLTLIYVWCTEQSIEMIQLAFDYHSFRIFASGNYATHRSQSRTQHNFSHSHCFLFVILNHQASILVQWIDHRMAWLRMFVMHNSDVTCINWSSICRAATLVKPPHWAHKNDKVMFLCLMMRQSLAWLSVDLMISINQMRQRIQRKHSRFYVMQSNGVFTLG